MLTIREKLPHTDLFPVRSLLIIFAHLMYAVGIEKKKNISFPHEDS